MRIKTVGTTSIHSIQIKYKVVGYHGLGVTTFLVNTKKEAEKKFNLYKKHFSGVVLIDLINKKEIKSWKENN